MRTVMLGAAALTLAACNATTGQNETVAVDDAVPAAAASATAVAALRTTAGDDVGTATVTAATGAAGLTVMVAARGLPAGIHGVHIHMTGSCEGPGFTSAGGHWNPTARKHGSGNPMGPHEGDLPNLTIAADGTGTLRYTIDGAALGGAGGLLDADGAAFVVHAKPDDYVTDPSGNSGDRIACGTFR